LVCAGANVLDGVVDWVVADGVVVLGVVDSVRTTVDGVVVDDVVIVRIEAGSTTLISRRSRILPNKPTRGCEVITVPWA
jgi:hypothetical protein